MIPIHKKHRILKGSYRKRTPDLRKLLVKEGRNINKCEVCGKTNLEVTIHIHHKDKNIKNNKPNNLIICCVPCHKRLDGQGHITDYAKKHNIGITTARKRLLSEDKLKELEEKDRIWRKNYYKLYPKKRKEINKRYNKKHKLEKSKRAKEYYLKNKEKILSYSKNWRNKNRAKRNECIRKWKKENPDKIKEYNKRNYEKRKGIDRKQLL